MPQVLAAAALMTVFVSSARAAVTVTFQEVGNDVVATTAGSFNSFNGLNEGTVGYGTLIYASTVVRSDAPMVAMAQKSLAEGGMSAFIYTGYQAPTNFGTVSGEFKPPFGTNVTTITPDTDFNIQVSSFSLNKNYILGTPITSTGTYLNRGIEDLGLAPGTYTFTWAGDSLSVIVIGNPIPEPSTYGLILGGLALAGAVIRRRKISK